MCLPFSWNRCFCAVSQSECGSRSSWRNRSSGISFEVVENCKVCVQQIGWVGAKFVCFLSVLRSFVWRKQIEDCLRRKVSPVCHIIVSKYYTTDFCHFFDWFTNIFIRSLNVPRLCSCALVFFGKKCSSGLFFNLNAGFRTERTAMVVCTWPHI